jgi:Holliday junction resolvase
MHGTAGNTARRNYLYRPDLVANEGENMYVVEIKVDSGIQHMKEDKLRGLTLAKEYGLILAIVTLNIDVEVSSFKMSTLTDIR